MRKANLKDMFNVLRFLNEANMKDDVYDLIQNIEKNADVERVGFDFIFLVISKCSSKKCERAFYEAVCDPLGYEADEMEKVELSEFIKKFNECFDYKSLLSFFASANSMMK